MSNRARRRHLHPRHTRHAVEGKYPVMPGVVPDTLPETLDRAMAEAHDTLPRAPNTRVTIATYEVEAGIKLVAETFGEAAAVLVMARVLELGPAARVTICARLPHEVQFDD